MINTCITRLLTKYVENVCVSNTVLTQLRYCSIPAQSDEEKEKEIERIKKDAKIDEPPTSCCQSGCANCVFIVWAEALSEKMQKNPEIASKILNLVEDPSMRAYLEMELRIRGLTK